MKTSRFFGLLVVLTLLITLSQTMVSDSGTGLAAGTAFTVNAYDVVGNESGQGQGVWGVGENAHAQGTAINAASCEQTDVQAAIDSATTGDTVLVPAGECIWSAGVSIPDNKKITLQGAGMDSTVITRDGTAISMNQSGARVTGIGFVLPSGGSGNSPINVRGTGWRVDHCKFTNNSGDSRVSIDANGRNVSQYPTGLVDNCVFINGRILVNGAYTFEKMSGIWAGGLNLATEHAVYIEDCDFTRNDGADRNAIDGNRGGMTVFRYNTVEHTSLQGHSLQSDNERAFRKWEIYGNTLHSATSVFMPIRFIGGTGVIFNNQLSGDYNLRDINFYNRRCYDSIGVAGLCDGSSAWDGNQDANGWPCRDQIGRGPDEYLFDKDSLPYPSQASVPAYLWLNRDLGLDGNSSNIANVIVSNNSDQHIKPNRDYYNEVASFDGTSGVGTGTLAERPTTCTPNVSYWATDQGEWNSENPGPDGQLYKCTTTDTWELYYTPYTYPHPLRGESLVLHGLPADQAIHLSWQIGASLPPTSTWQIVYDGPTGDQPSPISGILSPTRAYTLTGLTNYTWYTVTLNAMLDGTPFLTDTVRVMPSDIFIYLPLVLKGPG